MEWLAMRDIWKDTNLVFLKTDNRSVTVIIDKEYYLAEGYRQLNIIDHYK